MTTTIIAAEEHVSLADVSMHRVLGHTELAAGRPALAARHFAIAIAAAGTSPRGLHVVPDLVEAAVRAGTPELVRGHAERFEAWAGDSASPLLLALSARVRALLSLGCAAEAAYGRAMHFHARADEVIEQARTQLLYGEYLRRIRRRSDACVFLAAALDTFRRVGALTWADRARIELQAATDADPAAIGWRGLTMQQRRIAEAVSQGASNREVAARLFLSPRTVEYHLRNVYIKLGIGSRSELIRYVLTSSGTAP
ncbi:helix-turn-helix transcriptional regulator [Phytoactinopolyspora halotolerans]|uniref:Helix-turn-helix transcriptional regulator n=1 Tax=Phytoactinopolyspora halotolerans TaxID=1981512 RepID=A0A6L9SF67_9ACTN|nr:helix-turn-helix transcriptional regulator [Phytoactinopolyspora halotolerans]NEE03248.1 helix-turn-helix transcriptional regulator [Phytoactinopolyspora halotolerans]